MKLKKSQLKELIRNSIREIVSEQKTIKFKDPETGEDHEITMDTAKRYAADIKAGDKSKEKIAAVKAANLDKGDTGDKEKTQPKKTKIKADPFGDKEKETGDHLDQMAGDDDEDDVGGPAHPNVSKKGEVKPPQPSDFDGDMDKYLDALNQHMKDV